MTRHILILGNGYDLYLGRKTSYRDFYNWLNEDIKRFPAPLISHLNGYTNSQKGEIRWYDLENEFLNYFTQKVLSSRCYDCYTEVESYVVQSSKTGIDINCCIKPRYGNPRFPEDQIRVAINELLHKEVITMTGDTISVKETIFSASVAERDYTAFIKIKNALCEYTSLDFLNIDVNNCDAYSYFYNSKLIRENSISAIYTFNYTKTLYMDLFGSIPVFHVHGSSVEHNNILGTQENEKFEHRKEYRFLQKAFDNNYKPANIISDLSNLHRGDMVTFFGHSLGVNDRQYFSDFFKRQSIQVDSERLKVNFIFYESANLPDIKSSIQQMSGFHLSDFMCKNEVHLFTTKNGFLEM